MKKMILLSIITTLMLSVVGCGDSSNSEIESSVGNSESKISEGTPTEDMKVKESTGVEIETTTTIEIDFNEVDKNDKSKSDYFEITDYRIENDYYWNDYEHGAKITFVVRNISDKELTFEAAELLYVKENEIIIPKFSSDCGVKLEPNQATEFETLVDYPDEYVRYEVEDYIYSTDSESYIEGHFSEKYIVDLNETATDTKETSVKNTDNTKIFDNEEELTEYISAFVENYKYKDIINYDELKEFMTNYFDYLDEEQKEIMGCAIGKCKIEDMVVSMVKENMLNPSSFELIKFDPGYIMKNSESDKYSSYIKIEYRDTNTFGGVVTDTLSGLVYFTVDLKKCTISREKGEILF